MRQRVQWQQVLSQGVEGFWGGGGGGWFGVGAWEMEGWCCSI